MRVNLGMMRHAKGKNRVKAMLRRATTMASTKHTISGKEKTHGGARPVTLPKLHFSDSAKE
jgi:hypothetical protein